MERETKKRNWLRIVEIVLAVFFVMNLTFLVGDVIQVNDLYTYDEYDLKYTLEKRDFAELSRMLLQNETAGEELKGDAAQIQAISAFYENAVLCHAYQNCGDQERAERYKEQLKAEREKVDSEEFISILHEIEDRYQID